MSVAVLQRRFKYNQLILDDPDPQMPLEAVKDFYSGVYPELTQAVTEGPELTADSAEYTFRRAVGTKGQGRRKKSTQDAKESLSVPESITLMESLSLIVKKQPSGSPAVLLPSFALEPV